MATRNSLVARTSSAGNPISQSVAVTADDDVIVVMLNVIGATARTGGALTYNSQTLTQANSTQIAAASPEASAEIWYLLNPVPRLMAAGTYTLTIPNTAAQTIKYTVESGRPPAGGTMRFNSANGGNNTSVNPTPGAVTVTAQNSIAWAITAGGWQTWAPTGQGGTIIANTDDGATGGGEQYSQNPALGSLTLNWTFATSDDWGAVVALFDEVSPNQLNNYMRGFGSG